MDFFSFKGYLSFMNIQIFGTKKCKNTKKGILFLKERSIQHHFVDLKEKSLSDGEWTKLFQQIKPEELVDSDSAYFKKNGFSHRVFDPVEELIDHPDLLITPVLRIDGKFYKGFDLDQWKVLLQK